MRPDLSTFRVLPHVARPGPRDLRHGVHATAGPVEASPRRVLQRQVERAAEHGLTALMQAEYEFYLLDGRDAAAAVRRHRHHDDAHEPAPARAAASSCATCRPSACRPRTLNQEWGPTQYELTFSPVEGLAGGDDNFTYKTYAKEIAAQHGLLASFMTKPFIDAQRLEQPPAHEPLRRRAATSSGTPTQGELTPEFRWAIGGLLEHAPALNAFLGPTVNCAKRYRKGTYAPASVTWGFENRSVAVRVKAGRGDATHIEDRLGSAASNPYLALAGMLVAMLDGIARRIEPPPPLQTNAYQLDDLVLAAAHARGVARRLRGRRRRCATRSIRSSCRRSSPSSATRSRRRARPNPGYGADEWHDEVTDWERDQFLFLA